MTRYQLNHMVRPVFSRVCRWLGDIGRDVSMDKKQARHQALSDLEARIQAASDGRDEDDVGEQASGPRNVSGLGLAARIGVELVVTTLVGTALGWFLDGWFGTRPWLMIVFMFLGGAAGISNVYRVVRGLDDGVGLGRAMRHKGNSSDGCGHNQDRRHER